MRNEAVLKRILVWAMCKCAVTMATPNVILENGGRLTNSILSRVIFILKH